MKMPFCQSCCCSYSGASANSSSFSLSSSAGSSCRKTKSQRLKAVHKDFPPIILDRHPCVGVALSYFGDAVFELFAREHMLLRVTTEKRKSETKIRRPQRAVTDGWTSSSAMKFHLNKLLQSNALTDEELEILRWGRTYGHESRAGHNNETHRDASSFEALVG